MDGSAVLSRVSWKPAIQEESGATKPDVIALMWLVMCQSRIGGYVTGRTTERGRDGSIVILLILENDRSASAFVILLILENDRSASAFVILLILENDCSASAFVILLIL
ncbi:UNVERIFIED_CONTAM: hypothetical protein FKN15_002551 [Acipenser sinensis]